MYFINRLLCRTSVRKSAITSLWEKLNKIHVWINCIRSRECRLWRFWESNYQKFFPGEHAAGSPYIICAFRTDSPLVSSVTLVLNVQLQKNSLTAAIPGQNVSEWYDTDMKWFRLWMKTEVWTPKKLCKMRLSCYWSWVTKSLSQSGDQKSSRIMNLQENSCRNHDYQDSNDSASTPEKDQTSPETWVCNFRVIHSVVDLEHITSMGPALAGFL